ncbi:hypothetical protein INT45_002912 [Circinella minor]|uniref:Uncharacterized protein n=1 Tax=Circinella minor TaxID=1195481 RepID=A0A8H7RU42_9FUNG|nr:hypothetical protein INT45_002912 [Circinella minor]
MGTTNDNNNNNNNKKVVLITGGTSGLGRNAAKYILSEGHTVIITGRSKNRIEEVFEWIKPTPDEKARLHSIVLHLDNLESIRNAVESFKSLNLTLDTLINNAGAIYNNLQYSEETTVVEKTFFTNIIGPWYFTMLIKPYIIKGGRILFATSGLHDPEFKVPLSDYAIEYVKTPHFFKNLDGKQSYNALGFYKASKLAMMWIAYLLVKQMSDLEIITFEPGFIPTTELTGLQPWLARMFFRYIMIYFNPATTTEDTCANWYRSYATSPTFNGTSASSAN